MFNRLFVCLLLLTAAACARAPYSALDDPDSDWAIVFQDEFEGSGEPDPTKWIVQEYNRRSNAEGPDGWWLKENVFQDGQGHLVIRVTKIDNHNPDEDSDPHDYATGMVSTEGLFEPRFGRFEARVKLQKKTGWWSAFWMFADSVHNEDGSGEDGTEIDIFEGFGKKKEVHQALHWDGYEGFHQTEANKTRKRRGRDGWHVVALEWTADEYIFFLDGRETWRTDAGGVSKVPTWLKLSGEIADVSWATNDGWAGKIDPSSYPDYFMVDWVRAYEYAPEPSSVDIADATVD